MCVHPYIAKDKLGNLVPVPCGKCFQCLQQWSRDWRFRLEAEQKNSVTCLYLTLTYRPECLPVSYNDEVGEWQSYVSKRELQNYFKRLRKMCPGLKFRYFAIGEYGGDFNRAHYHVIFFFSNTAGLTYAQMHSLMFRCWNKGFIKLKVTEKCHIKYLTGYFNKLDKSSHLVQPFKLMSKSIGLCWLTDKVVNYLFEQFKTAVPSSFSKSFQKIPRYYRKKLDEMTSSVVPDNYGYVWSDIVKLRQYKPKGLNVYFDEFIQNFDSICHVIMANEARICREKGYNIQNLFNPNTIFSIWYRTIPELVNAYIDDCRSLHDAQVQHKYTRLKENFEYG